MSIGLIIGNGLVIDLRSFLKPSLKNWNPQKPLGWELFTPGKPDIPLLESLPYFAKTIEETKQEEGDLSDFDMFERILQRLTDIIPKNHKEAFEKAAAEEEMRHFLSIAYSHFQLKVDSCDTSGWPWLEWIRTFKEEIKGYGRIWSMCR